MNFTSDHHQITKEKSFVPFYITLTEKPQIYVNYTLIKMAAQACSLILSFNIL